MFEYNRQESELSRRNRLSMRKSMDFEGNAHVSRTCENAGESPGKESLQRRGYLQGMSETQSDLTSQQTAAR